MKLNSKKGFTIIEVVLVLAIAGLIFLMVFIALPNMQRSQRDRQKTNDYTAFMSNITGYITNNNGKLPAVCNKTTVTVDTNGATFSGTGICASPDKYINQSGTDQNGIPYTIQVVKCNGDTDCGVTEVKELTRDYDHIEVLLVEGAECGDQGKVVESKGTRAYAMLGQLEVGVFCQQTK